MPGLQTNKCEIAYNCKQRVSGAVKCSGYMKHPNCEDDINICFHNMNNKCNNPQLQLETCLNDVIASINGLFELMTEMQNDLQNVKGE